MVGASDQLPLITPIVELTRWCVNMYILFHYLISALMIYSHISILIDSGLFANWYRNDIHTVIRLTLTTLISQNMVVFKGINKTYYLLLLIP